MSTCIKIISFTLHRCSCNCTCIVCVKSLLKFHLQCWFSFLRNHPPMYSMCIPKIFYLTLPSSQVKTFCITLPSPNHSKSLAGQWTHCILYKHTSLFHINNLCTAFSILGVFTSSQATANVGGSGVCTSAFLHVQYTPCTYQNIKILKFTVHIPILITVLLMQHINMQRLCNKHKSSNHVLNSHLLRINTSSSDTNVLNVALNIPTSILT